MLEREKIYLLSSTGFWPLNPLGLTDKFMLPKTRSLASHFVRQKCQYDVFLLASWDHEQILVHVPRSHATLQAKKFLLIQISMPN